jgi:hypothetical protein
MSTGIVVVLITLSFLSSFSSDLHRVAAPGNDSVVIVVTGTGVDAGDGRVGLAANSVGRPVADTDHSQQSASSVHFELISILLLGSILLSISTGIKLLLSRRPKRKPTHAT